MGRYSSESDNSRSSKHKKTKRVSSRSSRARSRSSSPKRLRKKLKKYKRSNRSVSRDTKNRHSSDRKSKYRHRSRSYSDSPSDRRRKHSSSRDSDRDRRYKDDYKKSKSKRRHHSSSSSSSSSSLTSSSSSKSKSATPKRKFDYDPDELLEKLNKAAVEAMAANKKINPDPVTTIEMQIKRQDIINELRGNSLGSFSDVLQTNAHLSTPLPPPAPLLSTKLTDKLTTDDSPVVVDLTVAGFPSAPSSSSSANDSLLHPNFLLENQEEKLNRWVKKLYQIRQRATNGSTTEPST